MGILLRPFRLAGFKVSGLAVNIGCCLSINQSINGRHYHPRSPVCPPPRTGAGVWSGRRHHQAATTMATTTAVWACMTMWWLPRASSARPTYPASQAWPSRVQHSANYRSPQAFAKQKVMVVGASLSGVEVAAEVARHAQNVVHVMSRPLWVMPRYLPSTLSSPAPAFLPLDLVLYRRSKRKTKREVVFRDEAANRCVLYICMYVTNWMRT